MSGRRNLPNQKSSPVRARLAAPLTDLTAIEADITTNATNIATNTTNIDTNVTNITTNTADITALETSVAGLDAYTTTDFNTDFATKSTSDLSEGSNLYYTAARANTAIDARVNSAFINALTIDADTLDGLDSTAFALSSHDVKTVASATSVNDIPSGVYAFNGMGYDSLPGFGAVLGVKASGPRQFQLAAPLDNDLKFRRGHTTLGWPGTWQTIWNSGNFGKTQIDALNINATYLGGLGQSSSGTANTIAARNNSGDIHMRLPRTSFADQNTISGGIVYRVNNSSDNYLRVCNNTAAIRTYLGTPGLASNNTFSGTNTFTGFLVGRNSASTDVNTANDTGSFSVRGSVTTVASISFHRSFAYAINMGLGTDNKFRIGGWSAAADCLVLDGAGNQTLLGTLTAKNVVIGTGGTYAAGSLYSDSNWGMILRAKQASPNLNQFAFTNSAGGILATINTAGTFVANYGLTSTAGGPATHLTIARTGASASTMTLANTGNWIYHNYNGSGYRWQTGGSNRLTLSNAGHLTATGNITAYSDERLKTDIETLDGSKVFDMRGVSFLKEGVKGSGVIAQEMQKVAPELVLEGEEYMSVAYGNTVGYLIEAVKLLKQEIEDLKEQLNASSG